MKMEKILFTTFLLFLFSPIYPCDGLISGNADSVCQQVMDAAAGGNLKKMKSFIKSKQHKITDKYGRTPLMIAAVSGQVEVAELLIKNGADVDAVDKKGFTPLMYAAGFKHILKSYGLWGGMRETQAMFTLKGRVAVFRILFDRLADVDAKTKDGDTVFSIVKKEGVDDFNGFLADVDFNFNGGDFIVEDILISNEDLYIPNNFNPWDEEWKKTPEKFESGWLNVSTESFEIRDTVFTIGDFEENDGKKYKTLQVHVNEKGTDISGEEMFISFWGERWIKFNYDVSLLLFEYTGAELDNLWRK